MKNGVLEPCKRALWAFVEMAEKMPKSVSEWAVRPQIPKDSSYVLGAMAPDLPSSISLRPFHPEVREEHVDVKKASWFRKVPRPASDNRSS
ncbi:hypothetical protein GJ744_003798 [Endocarpon pusillum]|uniref:Uncharacterized protein n=1 Tax=Endocarpon pusillum TaxID=364733 RepID=A0A8H7ALZ7_9EURO|nr:hypothetical protein GJ744_003798 [Endocarpon pusillum]